MEQIEIKRFLLNKGIHAHLKGFDYLARALEMCQEHKYYIRELTKSLYPELGKEFGDSSTQAERAMRHALSSFPKHIKIGEFLALSLIEMEECKCLK